MPESSVDDRELFDQFMGLYELVEKEAVTGDAGLDVFLRTARPALATLVQDLAVAHWFNQPIVASLENSDADSEQSESLAEVTALPFVRTHPLGFTYHDATREALRRFLIREHPERMRTTSHKIAATIQSQYVDDDREQAVHEITYLALAYDEPEGLKGLELLLENATLTRRFSTRNTLLRMAAEQRDLLSNDAVAILDYNEGLLALDLHRWDDAAEEFALLWSRSLPASLSSRVRYGQGRVFEAKGLWLDAERVYRSLIALGPVEGISEPRVHRSLAMVLLALGDVKEAEGFAQQSLRLSEASKDRVEQANAHRALGMIHGRLHELKRARLAFERSQSIFAELDLEVERANVLVDSAEVTLSYGRIEEARERYERALDIKIAADDNYGAAFIRSNLGSLHVRSGDMNQALEEFQHALSVFYLLNDNLHAAKVLRNLAITYERLGDLEQAIDYVRRAADRLPAESRWHRAYDKELRRLERKAKRPGRSKIAPAGAGHTIIG